MKLSRIAIAVALLASIAACQADDGNASASFNGLLHYRYPSPRLAVSPDTTELYLSLGKAPFTVKHSHALGNLLGFVESRNSGYLDWSATVDLGDGWTLTPHVGHQRVAGNGTYSYADVSLTVAKAMGPWSLGAALVADTKHVNGMSVYASPAGQDLGKPAVLLSARFAP